ncbi:unnamed protein product [Chrysoparadoxa australica]
MLPRIPALLFAILAFTAQAFTLPSSGVGIWNLQKQLQTGSPSALRPSSPRVLPPAGIAMSAEPKPEEPWVQPAVFNKGTFRSAAIVAVLALSARATQNASATAVQFCHLLTLATWIGSTFWTTFVAGIVMFKNLPRQTFGKLQAKLFPLYFALNTGCVIAVYLTGGALASSSQTILGLGLAGNLLNLLCLEPLTTNNMMKRYELEGKGGTSSDAYKALKKAFGPLHGLSSLANLGALLAGITYVWRVASSLV